MTAEQTPRPPARPAVRGVLLRRPSARGRWAPASRAGLSLAAPAAVLALCGFGTGSLLAAMGAFAVLYGERRPYLIRWKVILTAGALLIVTAAVFGSLGATAGPDASTSVDLAITAALAAAAGVSVFVNVALRLGPPGSFFFALVAGVSQVVTRHGVGVGHLVLFASAGAAAALIVGMAPALWSPRGPESAATAAAVDAAESYVASNCAADPAARHGVAVSTLNAWSVLHDAASTDGEIAQRLWSAQQKVHGASMSAFVAPLPRPSIRRRLRFAARRDSHAAVAATRAAVTALVAGSVAVLSGLGRPDWAVLGAVLVLQLGPDRVHGSIRGVQRVIGTIAGVGLYAILHLLDLQVGPLIVVLAVLNVLIELTVATNYAVAVLFITPLALLMGGPSTPLPDQIRERILETSLGVAVALAVLWLLLPRIHRSTTRSADIAVLAAGTRVLTEGAELPVDSDDMRVHRRDLQWQLIEAELAATDSACDEPPWARRYWPEHTRVRDAGYDVLSACWRTPLGQPIGSGVRSDLSARIAR
ncbi:hypothetical protein nbrc107696_07720 [Gordonia spumicola]|uniref:Integral membrane bound transporter domain-containing protein n=1 Tax=Gordonia spumicola TaxID=589161 RepID=A0A7I9V4I8_9ACTN|nr:FUSC family protein [Gordonia spumicola]GEE00326.1 hypothetical protein nbrc107696_07720 [Gordonia spumicola]